MTYFTSSHPFYYDYYLIDRNYFIFLSKIIDMIDRNVTFSFSLKNEIEWNQRYEPPNWRIE